MVYKGKHGFEYPEFFEIYEKACASTWTHHEVSMSADLRDWQFNTTPAERQVIAGTLRGFVASELGIGDYWSDDVCQMFKKPEIHAMARAFSFFETLHAAAYSYLNDVLGLNEYEEFIQDPVAIKKIEAFFSTYPSKVKLAVFSGAGEGVSLFSSFAILLSFNIDGRFKGLAQIISWSALDEQCVHSDTQVLTPAGWKKVSDYTEGEKIAQYDPELGTISFVVPNEFIQTTTKQLIKVSKPYGFSQQITPNHTIVLHDTTTENVQVVKKSAAEWQPDNLSMPVSGHFYFTKSRLTPQDQLHLVCRLKGVYKGDNKLKVKINDSKLADILTRLLKEQGHFFTSAKVGTCTIFYIARTSSNTLSFFEHYKTLDKVPDDFLSHLAIWSEGLVTDFIVDSDNFADLDFIQAIAHMHGSHTYITQSVSALNPRSYKLHIKYGLDLDTSDSEKLIVNYDEPKPVYCFKVPTQSFLIRENHLVSATGNCHAQGGIALFKALVEEQGLSEEEKQQIYEGFKLIVDNEFAFIDSIFNKVSIPSLSPDSLKSYILSRANKQLLALDLDPIFVLSPTQTKLAYEIAEWFEPMAFGLSSNDFFAQSKDGSGYASKLSQDFEAYNLDTLDLSEFTTSEKTNG